MQVWNLPSTMGILWGSAGLECFYHGREFCWAVQVWRKRVGVAQGLRTCLAPAPEPDLAAPPPPCLQLWIIPSILGSSNLYFLSDDDWETISAWIYGLGLCGLFVVSTVFHTISWKKSHLRYLLPSPQVGACAWWGHQGWCPRRAEGEARCLGLCLAEQRGAQDGRPCATFASGRWG